MLSIFVNDGYTLAGHVDAVAGLFPRVEFTYRPAAPSLRFRYQGARGPDDQERVASEIMAEQLIGIAAGEDLTERRLTAEQCRKLHADLFNGIWNYILGYQGPDPSTDLGNSGTASGSP